MIRGGSVSQSPDNRLFLCDTVDELFTPPHELTCENSGKKLTVGNVTEEKFKNGMQGLVEFASVAGKHTKSNAIILAYQYSPGKYRVLGMGAGQPNRLDSGRKLSLPKARENLMRQYFREQNLDYAMVTDRMMQDSDYNAVMTQRVNQYIDSVLKSPDVVLFSDAFFPKRDGLVAAAELGAKYIVAPGGSNGDPDVIKAANELGVAMIFTGTRHFRH